MRYLLALLLVLVGSVQGNTQVSVKTQPWQWIGCYELTDPPADKAKQIAPMIPYHFQLLWKRTRMDGFELKALDLPDGYWWLSSWTSQPDGTLLIRWATGFVGYVVVLKGTGDRLTGTAQPYTDTDSPDHPRAKFPVDVRRVACPALPQGKSK